MPTRRQVQDAVRDGGSYESAAAECGIPVGQVYLIATGLPADGSDVLGSRYLARREDLLVPSSQTLVNPRSETPTTNAVALAWLERRAAADDPMRQAAHARTAEPPPKQERADDVVDVLGSDHNQVNYLSEQLQAIPGVRQGGAAHHQQMRVSIVDMIRLHLSQHESAEEAYLWPAVRAGLPDGESLAAVALEQEQQGKDLLQALDGLAGDDDRFDELVEQLVAALRKHVAFEDKVFLQVKDHLPEEQRDELGKKIRLARDHGPTRPHPHAPPGSKLAAAAAAPIDKLRDAVGDRPAKRHGKPEEDV